MISIIVIYSYVLARLERMNGMEVINTTVIANQRYGDTDDCYLITLAAPELARACRPGQFLLVRVGSGHDPLLRRPISICTVERQQGLVKLLYKVQGRGTALLAKTKSGSLIDVIGPLGNGFNLVDKHASVLIVGGGIGAAPLYLLAQELQAQGISVEVMLGARGAKDLLLVPEFQQLGIKVQVATDDGSVGEKGLVTALLPSRLTMVQKIYTCGPMPMMKAITTLAAQHQVPTEVSLEERMGCGVGACLACVCRIKATDGSGYKRVCVDGPVFDGGEVQWHE